MEMSCTLKELVYYPGSHSKTFSNTAVWLVLLLNIARYFWEHLIDSIIRKNQYKEYVRVRLKKALWHFFFNLGFIVYLRLGGYGKFSAKDLLQNTSLTNADFIFCVILFSFYVDSCIWEVLERSKVALSYGLFSALIYLGHSKLIFALTQPFAAAHVLIQLTRCIVAVHGSNKCRSRTLAISLFFGSLNIFILVYFVIIPASFGVPFLNSPTVLNLTFWCWITSEVYFSPLYRLCYHWFNHVSDGKGWQNECTGPGIECALFLPRDDLAYKMKLIKHDINEQKAKMIAKRKPRKANVMLYQTLKYVVAVNRKLKKKRDGNVSGTDTEVPTTENTVGEEQSDSTHC